MNHRFYTAQLAKTYGDTVSAWRPVSEGGEKRLCEAAPCALSRSAHTSSPSPQNVSYALPEAAYRLTLFTRPELWFALGDRVEVTDCAGRVFHGRTSDSFCYPTHCVTVVEVRDTQHPAQTIETTAVAASAGNEGCGTCGDVGQDSHEAARITFGARLREEATE